MYPKVSGEVESVMPPKQVTERMTVQEMVIVVDGPYPKYIKFQEKNGRSGILPTLKFKQAVEITYDIEGRKWTKADGTVEYFNTLVILEIKTMD